MECNEYSKRTHILVKMSNYGGDDDNFKTKILIELI